MKKSRWFWVCCIIVIALQYVLCIHYGMKREYLFCDEVYSYGLANCSEHTFLHPGSESGEDNEPLYDWVSGEYFTDYMNYSDETISYEAAYVNQARDVHPPLYYILLHTVCAFFPDAGYSVVPGLVLNMILLIFVDICLLYVASYLLGDRRYGLIAAMLWALSSVGVSNCMLIRMYMLQTLNVLVFTAAHIYIIRHKRRMTVPYFIMLALTVLIGGLTHYYFYFYVAGLGLCVCLYKLYMKQIKQMFAYGFSLVAGLVLAIAVFPATISHIFGYRGSYATGNLTGISSGRILRYVKWLNKAYFAGILPILFLIAAVLLIFFIILKFVDIRINVRKNNGVLGWTVSTKRREINREVTIEDAVRPMFLAAVVIADAILAFVGMQGSELITARYIYSSLPILAILVVWCMKKLLPVLAGKHTTAAIAVICLALCAGSLKMNGVDWQYTTYASEEKEVVESMAGGDCVIVCHGDDSWNNIYAGVNVFSVMDRCRYVYEDDVESIGELAKDCGESLWVAFVDDPEFTHKEIKQKLQEIIKTSKYNSYEVKYDYQGIRIYELTVDESEETK